MIIIGEKLNTSIEKINIAVQNMDEKVIGDVAMAQARAGADYIDVNCGTFVEREPELLKWMVEILNEYIKKPLSLDSPNPEAIKAALEANKNGKPIINSITGQKERYTKILPLVLEYKTWIIGLSMDDDGIPDTPEGRAGKAQDLVNNLVKDGVPFDDIFIDPMIEPMATNEQSGLAAFETISRIKKELPGIKTVCGLSNISFGLPARSSINKAFLTLAIHRGLDAAILDPLDDGIVPLCYAAQLLKGEDEYCLDYLQSIKELNKIS